MKNNKIILEAWNEQEDYVFFNALGILRDLNAQNSDYYTILDEYLTRVSTSIYYLSDSAIEKIKKGQNSQKINDIFIKIYTDASQVDSNAYRQNFKQKLDEIYSYFKENLSSSQITAAPAASSASATPAAAPAASVTQPTTQGGISAEPDQQTLNTAFTKYMGSSFDPNSSMDKGKMEVVKKALTDFQKQNNNVPFDINDSEDLSKMQGIMNAAYQSEEYKKAVGVSGRSTGGSTTTSSPSVKAAIPVVRYGDQKYPAYAKIGKDKYAPASADQFYDPNTPIYIQNPRKGKGEYNKPNYVEMRKERGSVRPKSQYGGVAGSVSNFLGDVGRTLDDASRGRGRFRRPSR